LRLKKGKRNTKIVLKPEATSENLRFVLRESQKKRLKAGNAGTKGKEGGLITKPNKHDNKQERKVKTKGGPQSSRCKSWRC